MATPAKNTTPTPVKKATPAKRTTSRPTPAELPAESRSAHHTAYDSMLLLDDVHPHPKNVRRDAAADAELIESIREQGLLQPLIVAPLSDEAGYVLIAGHRRLDGLLKAGYTHGPAVIRHDLVTEADQVAAMLVENGRRKDLTPLEEAEGYGQLRFDFGWKPGDIAKASGHHVDTINKRLRLLKLDDKVKTNLHQGQLTLDDALKVAELPAAEQTKVAKAAGTSNFRWELEQAKNRAKNKAAFDKKVAELKADGIPQVKLPAGCSDAWSPQAREAGITPLSSTFSANHADHPGCLGWYERKTWVGSEVSYVCTNNASHDQQLDERRAAEAAAADTARREAAEAEAAKTVARNLRVDTVLAAIKPSTKLDPSLVGLLRVVTLHLLDDAAAGGSWPYEIGERYFEVAGIPEDQQWGIDRLWTGEDRDLYRHHVATAIHGTTQALLRTFATLAVLMVEDDVDATETAVSTRTIQPREKLATVTAYLDYLEQLGHDPTEDDKAHRAAAEQIDELPS
ncbi:hypothetical protein GCM10022215_32450 [Nocardioides fonticola]|uniref:ParB-like N-terminal domain-containing protein n=1 Tax=Nocardioides fonticola TaxID=450363 RepID=A0ABP7XRU8_9ACTN